MWVDSDGTSHTIALEDGALAMEAADEASLTSVLERWTHFQECHITRVEFPDYGHTLRLVMDYIWDDEGDIRDDLDTPRLVAVEFSPLHALAYQADDRSPARGDDHSLGAGAMEISVMRPSAAQGSLAVDALWDWGGRSLHVEFDVLTVTPL